MSVDRGRGTSSQPVRKGPDPAGRAMRATGRRKDSGGDGDPGRPWAPRSAARPRAGTVPFADLGRRTRPAILSPIIYHQYIFGIIANSFRPASRHGRVASIDRARTGAAQSSRDRVLPGIGGGADRSPRPGFDAWSAGRRPATRRDGGHPVRTPTPIREPASHEADHRGSSRWTHRRPRRSDHPRRPRRDIPSGAGGLAGRTGVAARPAGRCRRRSRSRLIRRPGAAASTMWNQRLRASTDKPDKISNQRQQCRNPIASHKSSVPGKIKVESGRDQRISTKVFAR